MDWMTWVTWKLSQLMDIPRKSPRKAQKKSYKIRTVWVYGLAEIISNSTSTPWDNPPSSHERPWRRQKVVSGSLVSIKILKTMLTCIRYTSWHVFWHYDMCPDKSDLAALALELAVNTAQAGIGWFTWPNLAGNPWKSLFSLANRGKPIKYQSGIKEKLWSIGWISAGNRSLFSSQESQSGSTCSTVPTNWIPDRGEIQHCQ